MKRNLWPYAIIAYFAVFIAGIFTWVTFAMRHDDELVRADYYEHEIRYQDQIDKIKRTRALNVDSSISYDSTARTITVMLPREMRAAGLEGSVHLYRPSNARLDRREKLTIGDDGTQRIDTSSLEDGLWKVRVDWKVLGQEYFLEQRVVLHSR